METNATPTTDTGGAPSAPPVTIAGDDFTPAERAYFESRGADTSGLGGSPSPTPTPETARASQPSPETQPELEAAPDTVDVEGVTIGADGKARDRNGKFVKYVPHSVFHAKNEKLKQTAQELQAERERFIRAEERLNLLNEAIAGKDPRAPAAPGAADEPIDPEKDIFGAFKQAQKELATLKAELANTKTETRQSLTEAQNYERFKSDATAFVAKSPDFGDAFNHLMSTRHAELEFQGVSDKAARDAQITKEARALVNQAISEGKSAAERIYQLARARGYQPKAPAAVDPAKSAAASELERLNQNQAASLTLNGRGGNPSDKLSQTRLADMSQAEFDATMATYVAKYGKSAWNDLLAGRNG